MFHLKTNLLSNSLFLDDEYKNDCECKIDYVKKTYKNGETINNLLDLFEKTNENNEESNK